MPMSIFNFIFGNKELSNNANNNVGKEKTTIKERNSSKYIFIDTEITVKSHKINDIGAIRHDGTIFHKASKSILC